MNIREDGLQTGGATAPATPPTPPVHLDHDDRYLSAGAGQTACLRDWDDSGCVALANFNQVPRALHRCHDIVCVNSDTHATRSASTSKSRPLARACGRGSCLRCRVHLLPC
jgi:hypothetical protein